MIKITDENGNPLIQFEIVTNCTEKAAMVVTGNTVTLPGLGRISGRTTIQTDSGVILDVRQFPACRREPGLCSTFGYDCASMCLTTVQHRESSVQNVHAGVFVPVVFCLDQVVVV